MYIINSISKITTLLSFLETRNRYTPLTKLWLQRFQCLLPHFFQRLFREILETFMIFSDGLKKIQSDKLKKL